MISARTDDPRVPETSSGVDSHLGGPDLLAWLAHLPASERDAAIEARLGIDGPVSDTPPGEHLIGHHASGVAPIVRTLIEVPVVRADTVVDLGSGLGKFVLVARLLTGANVRGIELQPELISRARRSSQALGVDVDFIEGDARDAPLEDGTVFFLYAPFTGPVLDAVARRLHAVAKKRAITVAALGIDLHRSAPWLVPRPMDSFWLSIYDSSEPGVPPRPREHCPLPPAAHTIAFER
jgi:SAM-dependent methyltransferase